jgi:hypothetical protein
MIVAGVNRLLMRRCAAPDRTQLEREGRAGDSHRDHE